MLNESIRYTDGILHADDVSLTEVVAEAGTPTYIYSLRRVVNNLRRIEGTFAALQPHIHYSAKANGNLAVLSTLINAGAGVDAVSAGEIHRALKAGAKPGDVVFAGVGKTPDELRYALEQRVGWFNVENVAELRTLNDCAGELGLDGIRVALRLNPDVQADTHAHIATGHASAKFGLPATVVRDLFAARSDYPNLHIAGIHVHIGSQLHNTDATEQAVKTVLELVEPYPNIRTVNIGGGLPVAYTNDEIVPDWQHFADTLTPLLKDYTVILEPGRSIIADAGVLVVKVLYVKEQGGVKLLIVDGSMTELMRPALYQAQHRVVMVESQKSRRFHKYTVVGPVCETTDVLAREVTLPEMQPGDLLAFLTAGAYGMVMSSNYNQRPRPPEVVVEPDGETWRVARRRETLADLLAHEL